MKIVITGANGLVGKALSKALEAQHEVSSFGHRDLDITHGTAVRYTFEKSEPDMVINCAVVQVDACELDPELAEAVNVAGPRNLALAAPRIVHFSTNYVFDGEPLGRPAYTISDEPRPINVYGRTKLQGEHAVIEANPQFFIIRTAWVYGPGKPSFLADVPANLREGKPVKAITDAYSTTTYVNDLVSQTIEIIENGEYGLYHVANSGVSSYYEFALEAARVIGLPESDADRLIVKVSESEMSRPARRPLWTPLESTLKPMRSWKEALAEYVEEEFTRRRERRLRRKEEMS